MKQFADYLSQFEELPVGVIEAVVAVSSRITFRKKDLIQQEGRVCRDIYFMLKGLARGFYYEDGKDITNSFSSENQVIAAMNSLYAKEPANYNVELLEDSDLLRINYDELKLLYERFPEVGFIERLLTAECYFGESKRNRAFQADTAKKRYSDFMKNYPGLSNRVNLGHIASYIGVSQVQLSRIRAGL